jgi:hypothetical protein
MARTPGVASKSCNCRGILALAVTKPVDAIYCFRRVFTKRSLPQRFFGLGGEAAIFLAAGISLAHSGQMTGVIFFGLRRLP